MAERSVCRGIGIEEAVVATLVSNRPSTFRINCVQCKAELIVPEKSESCDGKHIRHLWLCRKCETSFESLESIPVEVMTTDDIFPSTIVAWMRSDGRPPCTIELLPLQRRYFYCWQLEDAHSYDWPRPPLQAASSFVWHDQCGCRVTDRV